jgi:chemotaxis family two-component system sensor kinase Cph1
MAFINIVNRDLVNLTNCAHEPIHIPGSIQPHGCLLAIKSVDFTIDFCSENITRYTVSGYQELLGKNISLVFGEDQTAGLKKYLEEQDILSAPWELELSGKKILGIIHRSGSWFIIELEDKSEEPAELSDIYQQTKRMTAYIQKATTLKMLCQSVADETRSITGYDRVMIYRFDEEYNGEVFAESVTEERESFLGLHYPHTDIPAQARDLYIRNLLRVIVNISYSPSPIYTMDDAPHKNLDLSLATLRSVSPIHIQYLQNMGVAATLTISIIHEGRLWGLIACHHYTPKYITTYTRITALLQGQFLTSQISVRELSEEFEVAKKVNKALEGLREQIFAVESILLPEIIKNPELLSVTNATSVIILVDEKIYSHGILPQDDEIKKLANWLHTYNATAIFSTEKLSSIYPEAKKWCQSASGVLFHALGSGHNNCIIWFRPEALQEVYWAGNPDKAIENDEKGLSPRKSFNLWKETKNCESTIWQKPELAAASNFANALQKQVHIMFLTKEELKQRTLSEKLQEANSELENLNWISSHDLKEPLRKIQMFASRIIEHDFTGNYELVLKLVKKMSVSAERMQLLIKDILSYSRFSHLEDVLETVSLNEAVEKVIHDIQEEIIEKQAIVECGALPDVKGVSFLIQQLMINLISNALKFSKADVIPHIMISSVTGPSGSLPEAVRSVNAFHVISVKDNGIGFENEFREGIFKVFTKLHNNAVYSGSGVGLALCKKIMKMHNGYITAEGSPGYGASFSLYFPRNSA